MIQVTDAGPELVVEFEEEKETKGTWKFAEVLANPATDEAFVGTLYVRKRTLGELGWQPGQRLEVRIGAA